MHSAIARLCKLTGLLYKESSFNSYVPIGGTEYVGGLGLKLTSMTTKTTLIPTIRLIV